MKHRIGTCSICGGPVSVPRDWMSTVPPTPTCECCGATSAKYGPVIPMTPTPERAVQPTDATGYDYRMDPHVSATTRVTLSLGKE